MGLDTSACSTYLTPDHCRPPPTPVPLPEQCFLILQVSVALTPSNKLPDFSPHSIMRGAPACEFSDTRGSVMRVLITITKAPIASISRVCGWTHVSKPSLANRYIPLAHVSHCDWVPNPGWTTGNPTEGFAQSVRMKVVAFCYEMSRMEAWNYQGYSL